MRAIQRIAALCLISAIIGFGAQAVEGSLTKEKMAEITVGNWTENCEGAWPVRNIVREFNKWNQVKIGIDLRWVQANKQLSDFKPQNKSVLACCEMLAQKLDAHCYVVRDFLFIAPELPPGLAPAGGSAQSAAPGQKPEAPPAAKPPDPPAPPAGKPPSGKSNGNGAKGPQPPPAQGNKPADKPLPQMKPLDPGTGLAELSAAFPGVEPGTSHTIGWSHRPMKDALSLGLPVILLCYYTPVDPKTPTPDEKKNVDRLDKENKDTAGFFETLVLEDPELLKELKGNVTFICIPSTEPADSWPGGYADAAKKEGAALFLIAKDGRNVLAWDRRNPQCNAAALLAAVKPLIPAKPKAPPAPPARPDNNTVARKPDAPAGPNVNPPPDQPPPAKNDMGASKIKEE